jgi:hypothetical protein
MHKLKLIKEENVVRLRALDWAKWRHNTILFLRPLAILYLVFVIANIQADGFHIQDFAPSQAVVGAMALYVLNTTLDFFRKYSATKQ